jgi:hypothetical protein
MEANRGLDYKVKVIFGDAFIVVGFSLSSQNNKEIGKFGLTLLPGK